MTGYTPLYSISDKMIQIVSLISEKIGKISVYHNLDTKPHLRRNNRIRSIHSSLRIEANSLSLGQVKDVLDGKLVLGPELEIQEVRNAYEAYGRIGQVDPFSIEDLKLLHGLMEYGILHDAGRFRDGEEGVFNGDTCIFMAPPPDRIPALMSELFAWMKTNKNIVHPLIMSAIFHYEFVFIHPFSDGNGRMARLWHTVLLTNWNPVFEFIPLESQIEKFQDGYYQVIAMCHTDGKSDRFIEFMLERLNEILDEVLRTSARNDEMLSEYVKKLLNIMEFDIPYTSADLMQVLGLKSKETFRKNYLDPAMAAGVVEMTIPDKPRSKNQRYIKK